MEDPEVAWEVRKRECMIGCAQLSLQEERGAWRNGYVDECDREIVGNKYLEIMASSQMKYKNVDISYEEAKMAQPQPAEVDKQ